MARYLFILTIFAAALPLLAESKSSDWPQMRGPGNQGHAEAGALPTEWSESKNVKWKTPIPGSGWSSPVVYGNQVWLTTATNDGMKRRAIAVDRDSGKIIHNLVLAEMKKDDVEFTHPFNSHASPTPILEDGRAYISFGSKGLTCVDMKSGKTIWFNDDVKIDHFRGAGSSPIIYKDTLVLHYDGADSQRVVCYDKKSGKIIWNKERSMRVDKNGDLCKAFSVPLVIQVDGKDQLVSTASQVVYGLDPVTGKELWKFYFSKLGHSASATPTYDKGTGLIYINTGFGKANLLAIKTGGSGDISKTHKAWIRKANVPRMSSPVIVDGVIYMVDDRGVGTATDAKTGESLWQGRLGGSGYTGSPVYANGLIYFFDHKQGIGSVLKPGDDPLVIAKNKLDGSFMGSPAVSGSALIVRSKTHLYRLGK